jgi:protein TonB
MFEQVFVGVETNDKKRYTVVLSLLIQVIALAALIVVPLIYTQVLPRAQLRSVFAAPTPPPPALPKPPIETPVRTTTPPRSFDITRIDRVVRPIQVSHVADLSAPAPVSDPGVGGDPFGTGDPLPGPALKPPDPPTPAPVPKPANKPIRIASMEASQLIYKVQPAYPPLARTTHIQGEVQFTAVISKSGAIEHLQLVHGHPMLVHAAEEAILQWRYKPTLLNGEPVEVITEITVHFTLTQ